MARLLLDADHVVAGDRVLSPGTVAVDGEAIAGVGHAPDGPGWEAAERIDGTGCVAIPGLVNAHTHSGMTVMRGVADDQELMPWLERTIWPMEAQLTAEDVYWGASLAALEMLRAGVTAYADMYQDTAAAARAARDAGIRVQAGEALFGNRPGAAGLLRRAVEEVRDWGDDPLARPTLAPHALYTCPPPYLREVVAAAHELDVPIQIHVSETVGEVERCRAEHGGRSPVRVLDDLGVLERPTIAAHCVHVDDADIEILARRRVTVAHNPTSNMKLGSGIAPVERMLAAGVRVALGTDSAASNNTLSVLHEMRMAAMLAKVGGDVTALPARRVLELGTRGARLEAGAPADVVLVRLDRLHTTPPNDPVSHLAYSVQAADVDTVLVAGRPRVRSGRLVDADPERVKARCREIIARIRPAARAPAQSSESSPESSS